MDDIKKTDLVHFIGIGGCGMSAIAKIMLANGHQISGSDMKETVNTIRLRDEGATVHIGHDAAHLRHVTWVVVSTAIREDNPELVAARDQKLPILKRAEVLGWLMNQYEIRISIGGTHGKTTTTAMMATLLDANKLNATFSVGGDVNAFNTNAKAGDTEYFVTEADESDGSIVYLDPSAFILTNIEEDHLEYLGSLENIEKLFWTVISKLPDNGLLVINYDNPSCQTLIEKLKSEKPRLQIRTYGQDPAADYHYTDLSLDQYTAKAHVFKGKKRLGALELNIPGRHNIENALAVIAMAELLEIPFSKSQTALKSFMGTKRRFQLIGEINGIKVIDDYAHHPSEIKATLAAAKNGFQCRIVCAFQPHRYTRTMFLGKEFAKAFDDADVVVITDIYAAGESPLSGVSGKSIIDAMKNPQKAISIPKKEEISPKMCEILREGDLFLTLGAGDIHTVAKEVLMRLKEKG